MRALLIGRFQPFHKGHLRVIKKILEQADELIIGVGSSQHAHTVENPFSLEERVEMIKKALEAEGIKSYRIYGIPDINNDDLYPAHVISIVPDFDVIYSGNELVQRLFAASGKKVKKIRHIRRELYSGSEIRRRMVEELEWKTLLPPEVVDYILKINGVKRVRDLAPV